MKRFLTLVIAIMLVMTVLVSTAFADIRWIKTGNGKPANGRSGPGKDYEYITGVPYGTQVMISGASANGYTPIVLPAGESRCSETVPPSVALPAFNAKVFAPAPKSTLLNAI